MFASILLVGQSEQVAAVDVAITGIGVVSPIGTGLEAFCTGLNEARCKAELTPWAGETGLENVWVSWIDDFEGWPLLCKPSIIPGSRPRRIRCARRR